MSYRNIFDTHTHSDNSFDGNHSCILMCEAALQNGGVGIAITDHLDIDAPEYDVRAFTTNQFVESFTAKRAFEGKLVVLQGIELGQGIYKKELSEKILGDFKYDYILGAIHNLDNMEDFYYLDYTDLDVEALLQDYFEAILELAEWNKTDSIAHLTYPLRYIRGKYKIDVDMSKYKEIIDEILRCIIKNDKALELNVSGLCMELKDTLPSKNIIKRYRELGGKYVTVGSDSHYYGKVCVGIDRGYDILKECGFDSFTIFQQREPLLITIE